MQSELKKRALANGKDEILYETEVPYDQRFIETEKNAKYGSGHQQDEPFKMIMTDDSLMIEKGGLYFKTQKVGEVEWYQSLLNVESY